MGDALETPPREHGEGREGMEPSPGVWICLESGLAPSVLGSGVKRAWRVGGMEQGMPGWSRECPGWEEQEGNAWRVDEMGQGMPRME